MEVKVLQEEMREAAEALNAITAPLSDPNYVPADDHDVRFEAAKVRFEKAQTAAKRQEQIEAARTLTALTQADKQSFSRNEQVSFGASAADRQLAGQAWMLYHLRGGRKDITPAMKRAADKCAFDFTNTQALSFDQTIGTADQGGNLLDGSLYQGTVERSKEIGSVESLATIYTTVGDSPIHVAKVDNTSRGLTKISELGQATNTAVVFEKTQLDAYRYTTGVFPISQSFLRSAPQHGINYMANVLNTTYARAKNGILTNGDGNGDPEGLTVGLTTGVTGVSTTEIEFDEIEDLISSVDSSYYGDAVFMMNRSTYSYFVKQKTDAGTPEYPEAQNANSPNLRGFRVVYNPDMPAMTAGLSPIIFGSIRDALAVRNVGSVLVDVSTSQYWLEQALAVALWHSFDCAIVNPWAAKKFTMHA